MEIGKLKNDELEKYVFKNLNIKRHEVLISGGTGVDTAVLDFQNDLIVASTDPITGASKNIGSLAIDISVNDVCSKGAEPVGVLITALLPPSAKIEDLEKIIIDCNEASKKLNLDIIGGHTEVTDVVNKIVLSTTVIGRVSKDNIPKIQNIKLGDIICVSKSIGLEGTSIIYHDMPEIRNILTSEDREIVENLQQEISVKDEAMLAVKHHVKHMHDITEGGIYGALWETSKAIKKGISIDKREIPILKATEKIADFYKIDPYKLISSGSMIMIFDKSDYLEFKEEAINKNIEVTLIGEVTDSNDALVFDGKSTFKLKDPDPDELYRVIK